MSKCGKFVLTSVPDNQVGVVEAVAQGEGATVTKTQNADTSWTVTADYGPCPDGSKPVDTSVFK